jgi:hypothetical protein
VPSTSGRKHDVRCVVVAGALGFDEQELGLTQDVAAFLPHPLCHPPQA